MAIIKVSDLPQKPNLEGTDKIVGYSESGGTSLLMAQSFIDIQKASETAAAQAKASETAASASNKDMTSKIAQAKTDLVKLKTEAVSAVTTAKTTGVNEINNTKTSAVSEVNSAKTAGVSAVNDAQSKAVTAVTSQQGTSVNAVKSAQATATTEIDEIKVGAVKAVQAQEAASIESIKNSGPVLYVPQSLTENQRAQARSNIGTVAESDLSTLFYSIGIANTASAHNSIARGEDLKKWFTIDTLSQRVRAGDFTNIFIGDYIDVEMTSSISGTEMVRWLVAGIDCFLHHGYPTEVTQHHLVLMPRDTFNSNPKYNDTDTSAGGFVGSKMWKSVLPAYATAVKNAFGASHVLNHREILSNAMNASTPSMAGAGWTGATTGWDWYDVELMLPSEIQVYGSTVFSSSFHEVGNRNRQLPLFSLCQDQLIAYRGYTRQFRSNWWLAAVASASAFAYVDANGFASADGASVEWCGLRPYFLFS